MNKSIVRVRRVVCPAVRQWFFVATSVLVVLSVTSRAARADGTAATESGGVAARSVDVSYRFEADGTGTQTLHALFEITDRAGLEQFNTVQFAYDPARESARFDTLRTLKPSGTVIDADPARAFDADLGDDSPASFSSLRLRTLAPLDLAVGDRLEVRTVRTFDRPIFPGHFWVRYVALWSGAEREQVDVDVPFGTRLSSWTADGVEHSESSKDGRTVHRYAVTGRARDASSGAQRSEGANDVPLFSISTFQDWAELGRAVKPLFDGARVPTPELRALAARLAPPEATARATAEALYRHVSSEVRYLGLFFDGHGFRPHAAAEVLRQGYGDCKGKTALLGSLLDTAGIASFPAFVNTRHDLAETGVPTLEAFDHVVTVVSVAGEAIWVDATPGVAPFGVLAPQLRGRTALVLDPAGARLLPVPKRGPIAQRIEIGATGTLDETGTLAFDGRLAFRGDLEMRMRLAVSAAPGDAVRARFEPMAQASLPRAEITDLRHSDPIDTDEAFTIEYRARRPGWLNAFESTNRVVAPSMLGPMALPFAIALVVPETDEARGSGETEALQALATGPFEAIDTLTLTVDPGLSIDLPAPVSLANALGAYSSAYTLADGRLEVRRRFELKAEAPLPKARHPELKNLLSVVLRDLAQEMTVTRSKSAPPPDSVPEGLDAGRLAELGDQALGAGKPEAAIAPFRAAVEKDPTHAEAWNGLGLAYLRTRRHEDAERAFRRQLELDALHPHAWTNLALALDRLGRTDDAVAAHRRQIEVDPFHEAAHALLADTLRRAGRQDEAIAAASAGLKARRGDLTLLRLLAGLLARAGRGEEAAKLLRDAFVAEGRDASPEVVTALLRSAKRFPDDLPAWVGSELEVDADVESVAAVASRDIAARLRRMNARRTVDTAQSLARENSELAARLDQYAQALARTAREDEALDAWRVAFEINRAPQIAERLADAEAAKGRFEPALRAWAVATRSGPNRRRPPRFDALLAARSLNGKPLDAKLDGLVQAILRERDVTSIPWPDGLVVGVSYGVTARVLVDEGGVVRDAAIVASTAGAKGAPAVLPKNVSATLLAGLRAIRFPPLRYGKQPVTTTRVVALSFHPNGRVDGRWGFSDALSQEALFGFAHDLDGRR